MLFNEIDHNTCFGDRMKHISIMYGRNVEDMFSDIFWYVEIWYRCL
jgi:hypothetical protein